MKRRIFNAIAVVSAVLCVMATLRFFVTISHSGYVLEYARGEKIDQLRLQDKQLLCYRYTIGGWEQPRHGFRLSLEEDSNLFILLRSSFRFCGLAVGSTDVWGQDAPSNEFWIAVPQWLLVATTLLLPLWWVRGKVRAGRRVLEGHCKKCGYDLRATPERCPECGTPVPAKIVVPDAR